MSDLPPPGGEQSLIVLQATIAHLKKQVQKQAERARLAEARLAFYEYRNEVGEAA